MLSLITPSQHEHKIALRTKNMRLKDRLTQNGLAKRSGVSLGSIKRFEKSGKISLENLLNIALVLGCLDDFNALFVDQKEIKSIDDITPKNNRPKRGSIT